TRGARPKAVTRGGAGRATIQAMNDDILISTMNDVPGFRVVAVHGEVFGLIARARNVFSNVGAGLRTVIGGEAKGYTKLLSDSREQALDRMTEAARARGA